MKFNKRFILIIILIVIFLFLFIHNYAKISNESFQSQKQKYDCVISINIHEKFDFLIKQLDNIKNNVLCNYCVILNCNDIMFNECKKNTLESNIIINPIILNKRRNHGSLTEGIYNNMVFALENINFNYFLVMSSRNMFQFKLNMQNLHDLTPYPDGIDKNDYAGILDTNNLEKLDWHWPKFINTELSKYYISQKQTLYSSPHEGLCFPINTCKNIVSFLQNYPEISKNLFNFESCVEEYALQTIAMNNNDIFYYIGNGCCTEELIPIDQNETKIKKYIYKVKRE